MSLGWQLLRAALLGILVGVAALACSASAQDTTPGVVGPSRVIADAVPAAYPATYLATSSAASVPYPSTAYPTTDSARYPALANRTALSGAVAPPPSYSALPGISAATPNGGSLTAGPTIDSPTGSPQSTVPDATPLYTPYGSPEAMAAGLSAEESRNVDRWLASNEPWTWQLVPTGLMYKSYLAGGRESRLATQFVHTRDQGWLWDSILGAKVGLLRYGTENDFAPEGWQLDVEGAAFPRMNLPERDVVTCDYRIGAPLTHRVGPWETKFGYYHYCAHLGDEFALTNPQITRINYVRESLVFGVATYLAPELRLYAEASWAFHVDGEAQPWEFQFGADWSPPEPTGPAGAPFFAVNCHLREENDFGGNMTLETGWQWRGTTGHLFRVGFRYFNGMSEEGQFYNMFEEQIGVGIRYDF